MLLVGGESHKTGQGDSRERYGRLLEYLRTRFGIEAADFHWATQDQMPVDGVPYVGPVDPVSKNVYVATGFRKWGLAMGIASAELLTAWVEGRDHPWRSLYDTLASAMRASAGSLLTGGMSARGQRMPLGRLLIGLQVALSLVLLVSASLLVRNLRNIQTADAGLARDRLLHVELNAVPFGYTEGRLMEVAKTAAASLARIPGVEAVSYSDNGIFWGSEWNYMVAAPGFTGQTSQDSMTHSDLVGPGYIRAIGGRLLRGRDIEATDVAGATSVGVANEALVRHFFPSRDPIGQTISLDGHVPIRIVGVAANVKDHSLVEDVGPRIYMAYAQHPDGWPSSAIMLVRTSGDPERIIPQVRQALAGVDTRMKNSSISTVSALMRDSLSQERLVMRLAVGFGLVALLLAAMGLYGVMSYAVTRRTAEIGLRVALGAQRRDVIGMILRDAVVLVGLGAVAGLPVALIAAHLIRAQLVGVTPADPTSIILAIGVLATTAATAAFAPALRASRLAPLMSLRQE